MSSLEQNDYKTPDWMMLSSFRMRTLLECVRELPMVAMRSHSTYFQQSSRKTEPDFHRKTMLLQRKALRHL